MHTAYDTGAWAWYQRQTKQREAERRQEKNRCGRCGKRDNTGLIDNLCTSCFCKKLEGAE